jgi:transaldolase
METVLFFHEAILVMPSSFVSTMYTNELTKCHDRLTTCENTINARKENAVVRELKLKGNSVF